MADGNYVDTQWAYVDYLGNGEFTRQQKAEMRVLTRNSAMKIAAGLPTSKEAALATLDYARALVIQVHEEADDQTPLATRIAAE